MLPNASRNRARSLFVIFLILSAGAAVFLPLKAPAQDIPADVYEVTGRVVSEKETGVPQADASLFNDDGEKIKSVKADGEGMFKITGLAAGDYSLSVTHECCLPATVENVHLGGLATTTDVGSIMLRARPPVDSGDPVLLSGTVTSVETGEGVAGVHLQIESYWSKDGCGEGDDEACMRPMYVQYQYFETTTDPAGAFEVAINRGSASLRASHEGFDTTAGSLDASEDRQLDVPLRESKNAIVRLFGVLRNDAGETVSGGWVWAGPYYEPVECGPGYECAQPVQGSGDATDGEWRFEPTQQQYNSTQADRDGAWGMLISAGRLQVTASAEDHIEASKVVQADGQKEMNVDLVLQKLPPDSVTVTGTVVDLETGAPIPFAQVSLENQKWGTYAYSETDRDGGFEIRIKPGYTIVTFSAYKFYGGGGCHGDAIDSSGRMYAMPCKPQERDSDYLPSIRSINPTPEERVQLDAALKPRAPPSSEFKGYVLNETSNRPVSGASVTFYNEETRDWGSAFTDDNGSYAIKVHAGYYSIRIWAEGYFDGVQNAEISRDESQRLDFPLVPGQKRYGHWAYGGYAVAEQSAPAHGSPEPMRPEGPPTPSQGQEAYAGSGGGLGPFHPAEKAADRQGGVSPAFAPLAVVAGALAVAMVRRRRDA